MRRRISPWPSMPLAFKSSRRQQCQCRCYSEHNPLDLVRFDKATFYRDYPLGETEKADSLFENVSFNLSKPAKDKALEDPKPRWAIVSPSSLRGTTFLELLNGKHICVPPSARTYPYLAVNSRPISKAIQYVGFDAQRGTGIGGSNVRGAYLSARYESRREETDFSLLQYLTGRTHLNAEVHEETESERTVLEMVTKQLKLQKLLDMPVANLSNGQTRRARIARALMSQPDLLLLDGPFMGLDPMSRRTISSLLDSLSSRHGLELVLNFKLGEELPDWISHVVVLGPGAEIIAQGPKADLQTTMTRMVQDSSTSTPKITRDGFSRAITRPKKPISEQSPPEILIEMQGVKVSYGTNTVLGDWQQIVKDTPQPGLWWQLSRGQRWAVFGPNGSGKTTLLSLITSDHPQSYSLPIKFFGRPRLPEPGRPGISLFDIQKRIGHSSPEIHAFFPKHLTVRRVLESAWAEAPLSRPILTSAHDRRVDAYLRWFAAELDPDHDPARPSPIEAFWRDFSPRRSDAKDLVYRQLLLDDADLDWADATRFQDLSFSSQRLLLFLRALVAKPDLVILDEALSGVDETVRDKALMFLSWGEARVVHPDGQQLKKTPQAVLDAVVEGGLTEEQALVVISHSADDVPGCVRDWICLPEPGDGRPPRIGRLDRPLNEKSWKVIWGQGDASRLVVS